MVENLKRRHGQHSSLLLLLPFLREKAYAVPLGKIFRQEILSRKLRALHNGYYIDSQQNPLLSPAYHTIGLSFGPMPHNFIPGTHGKLVIGRGWQNLSQIKQNLCAIACVEESPQKSATCALVPLKH